MAKSLRCKECKSLLLDNIPPDVYLIIQKAQAALLMDGKKISLERVAIKLIRNSATN